SMTGNCLFSNFISNSRYFKQKGEPFSAKRFFVWSKKHFFSPHVVRIFSACRSETGLKASHDLPESLIFSSV
ncbi:hypothetical protein, partial [Paraprevotella clara]|uniref:hypothetical protein n=3 Tax=Paraprevotella clara TaxID=454154 RepID=UPI003F5C9E01